MEYRRSFFLVRELVEQRKQKQKDEIFKEKAPILWKCRNCGYVYEGAEAPEICPCCDHPKAFFERFAENY